MAAIANKTSEIKKQLKHFTFKSQILYFEALNNFASGFKHTGKHRYVRQLKLIICLVFVIGYCIKHFLLFSLGKK